MLGQIVPSDWLSTIFVDSLKDFVSGSVAEAGKQRDKLPAKRRARFVLEDDLVELSRIRHLRTALSVRLCRREYVSIKRRLAYSGLVAHQSFRDCVNLSNSK